MSSAWETNRSLETEVNRGADQPVATGGIVPPSTRLVSARREHHVTGVDRARWVAGCGGAGVSGDGSESDAAGAVWSEGDVGGRLVGVDRRRRPAGHRRGERLSRATDQHRFTGGD